MGEGGTAKSAPTAKLHVKREYSDAVEVASESDSESSSYHSAPTTPRHSAPTIHVGIAVQGARMDALADSGSSISLISKKVIAREKIPTERSTVRVKAGQAFSRKTAVLDRQVEAPVEIPSKGWTSDQPVKFFAADLAHSEAVLGMNFLEQEKALIDSVAHDIILPDKSMSSTGDQKFRNVSGRKAARAPIKLAEQGNCGPDNYYASLANEEPPPLSLTGSDDPGQPTPVPCSAGQHQGTPPSTGSGRNRKSSPKLSRQSRKLLRKAALKAERKRSRQLSAVIIDSRRIRAPSSPPPPPRESRVTEPAVVQLVNGPSWQPVIAPELAQRLHDEVVCEYKDIFADKLLPRKPSKPGSPRHRIILKDPDKSINGRMFALPEKFLNHMLEFLEEHLAAGRIRPSSSNMAAGTWMIPKNDKTVMPRVVHDYRALNENTVKDHTPLPRQDQILRRLAKSAIRGFVDCPTAYYQMDMEPDDIHKTAFKTPFGMFEWLVMPQGLCNAVGTWQRFMNWVLRKYIGKICYVYFDDIAIFSDSIEEHRRNVRLVLEALREAGIIVSMKKSYLFADRIEFLGHVVSSNGLEVGASKVEKILGWPAPRNVPEVRAFNGLVNYIGEFIPGLAEHSSTLSYLTKKGVEFEWKQPQQRAFENIKCLVQNTPVCRPIEYNNPDPIFLVADGSNHAIGGYYGQGKDHKTMRPAAFHSRSLNQAERNYPTHNKEMLAIID
jgi:Reverse transcriptase (RNA-dependent DNA polymerase)/RNase H-like domain found in reverse transcriptase/gag-polyprotein putative aspartyl protease